MQELAGGMEEASLLLAQLARRSFHEDVPSLCLGRQLRFMELLLLLGFRFDLEHL